MSYYEDRKTRYKELGLCINCGKKLDRQGTLCKKCLEKKNKQSQYCKREKFEKAKLLGIRLCPRCLKNELVGDERNCIECQVKNIERKKKRTEEQKKSDAEKKRKALNKKRELGICLWCSNKADEGYSSCSVCRRKNKERTNKCRTKKIGYVNAEEFYYERKKKIDNGFCCFCNEKALPGKKMCKNHYERINSKRNDAILNNGNY